jgi:hypothetical protein
MNRFAIEYLSLPYGNAVWLNRTMEVEIHGDTMDSSAAETIVRSKLDPAWTDKITIVKVTKL